MKLSIIVPVYNVEKYISRCLDSILKITSVDWECILIDDGSKDGSGIILDEYQEKYPDKFIVRHKENGGVASARNMGIDLAVGDRIMFIDPDDYFFDCTDMALKKALDKYKDKDIICFWDYEKFYDDGTTECSNRPISLVKNKQNDYIKLITQVSIFSTKFNECWNKIYKTEIIKKNKIYFDTSMHIGEDTNFVNSYLIKAKSIRVIYDVIIYSYYGRQGSATCTHSMNDLCDIIKMYKKRWEMIKKLHITLTPDEKQDMYCLYLNSFHNHLKLNLTQMNMNEFDKKCREIFSEPIVQPIFNKVNLHGNFNKLSKLCFLLKYRMYKTYYVAIKLKNKILCK